MTFDEWCSAALSASAIDQPLTVIDFGAKGDGVTDDTDAIQLAIDVGMATATGPILPRGVFVVTRRR